MHSSVRRILKSGGGGRDFFCPKLGEDQKKRSSIKFGPIYLLKIWCRPKTKVFAYHLCAQSFCPTYKGGGGGSCRNFAYYSMLIILSRQPKGGAMAQWSPPKYAPERALPEPILVISSYVSEFSFSVSNSSSRLLGLKNQKQL